jgi:hypothetical protein
MRKTLFVCFVSGVGLRVMSDVRVMVGVLVMFCSR